MSHNLPSFSRTFSAANRTSAKSTWFTQYTPAFGELPNDGDHRVEHLSLRERELEPNGGTKLELLLEVLPFTLTETGTGNRKADGS